jgi:hypothetical protein
MQILDEATSRQFNGGLDVADSELNLTSKYARELSNLLPGIDGSLTVRQGCREFADIASNSTTTIHDYRYFAGSIIVINEMQEIFKVDGSGGVTTLWNYTIAAAAGKTMWIPGHHIVFDEFNGNLIISDGVNKPLNITSAFAIDYLADLATGSNINVPVSHVSAKFDRHFVYADGSILNVSERDAPGTWSGDAGVVFAGTFDVGSYVTTGDKEIVAMMPYKNFLLVMFAECIVPVVFVEVAATATDPASLTISVNPESIVANYGTTSPRTLQDIGDMSLQLDIVGVSNMSLSKFTKILSPDRPSRLIDKLLQKAIGALDSVTLQHNVFSVYDRRLAMYMLFLPNDSMENSTYVRGFGYRYIDALKINAWCEYSDWRWRCGTRSAEGRLFFTRKDDTKIFVLGDETIDPIYADYVGEQETFSDGTTYTDQTGNGPVASIADSGVPIRFAWELPRTDLKMRGITKTLRYITIDAEGDQQFECQVFIDNFYAEANSGETFSDDTLFTDDTGFIAYEPTRTPALVGTFVGRDALGWGLQSYGTSPYGGGNNVGTELGTLMPTKFKTMKLRFEGEVMGPLKFVALTLHYQRGKFARFGP